MSAAMELHVALSLRLDATEAYRLAHAYRAEVLRNEASNLRRVERENVPEGALGTKTGLLKAALILDERADLIGVATNAPAATATPDAEAYDGELAMLRGLVRTLRVIVRADGSPEKQRAEVRQLLAEHAGDEGHARLLAMETASAYGAPKFFQAGHGYTHRDGSDFRCVAVTTHPVTHERLAIGWHSEHGVPIAVGINQWNHEYDGCEPPTSNEDGTQ